MHASLDTITAALRDMLPDLRDKFAVDKLWVFGSWVRGEHTAESDIDILVEFKHRNFSLLDFIALEQEIQERLGFTVDLVDRSALREELKPFVLPEAVAV
ncbi:MAG: uncharacterized protein QOJ65_1029 [Fimbriimonadaceae bacterium]|jgi:predicted nucleotidyltransferase|nr:uncharacterized protein [Fimbriimonadaceae bacterium]